MHQMYRVLSENYSTKYGNRLRSYCFLATHVGFFSLAGTDLYVQDFHLDSPARVLAVHFPWLGEATRRSHFLWTFIMGGRYSSLLCSSCGYSTRCGKNAVLCTTGSEQSANTYIHLGQLSQALPDYYFIYAAKNRPKTCYALPLITCRSSVPFF